MTSVDDRLKPNTAFVKGNKEPTKECSSPIPSPLPQKAQLHGMQTFLLTVWALPACFFIVLFPVMLKSQIGCGQRQPSFCCCCV